MYQKRFGNYTTKKNKSCWVENVCGELAPIEAQQHTLLVVDDDADHLTLTSQLLKRRGYRVLCASNAEQALIATEMIKFDLVICDLRMPHTNGIEFIKLLGKRQHPAPPVIITSVTGEEMELESINHGAEMYCPKSKLSSLLIMQVNFLLEEASLEN